MLSTVGIGAVNFAFSQGAVIWGFISEISPNEVRAKGQTLGSLTHWVMAAIITFFFPVLSGYLGIALIQQEYGIGEIVLTKGSDGASYYVHNEQHSMKAYPVIVRDTVGSGDSFLAAFLSQKLQDRPVEEMLDFASALGAYVTTQEGANPDYRPTDLNRFMWESYLEKSAWK